MSDLRDYKPLRLMAADADDLGVFSAYLQDAIAKVGDFIWLPSERRFAFVANRFLWELVNDGEKGPFWRARIGAHFDDVKSVKQINIKGDAKDAVVELLALRFESGADGGGTIVLDFAGAGAIRLEVDAINADLRDLTAPWRTRAKPAHAI